jgi:dimethylaniline monooxygenase (N-oxide forming)
MNPEHFQQFMEQYATHFDLIKDIAFNARVELVTRDAGDGKWLLQVERSGATDILEFDKVAFCHGYQTIAKIPIFEGEEGFEGIIMHSQQYRGFESKKKRQ